MQMPTFNYVVDTWQSEYTDSLTKDADVTTPMYDIWCLSHLWLAGLTPNDTLAPCPLLPTVWMKCSRNCVYIMCYSGVLAEQQLTNAVNTLCSLVQSTSDKLVCSKVFRCLAVQLLPKHIVTAQVTTQWRRLTALLHTWHRWASTARWLQSELLYERHDAKHTCVHFLCLFCSQRALQMNLLRKHWCY